MAETSGTGVSSGIAIGGIATVAVVVGGLVLTQLGFFDKPAAPEQQKPADLAVVPNDARALPAPVVTADATPQATSVESTPVPPVRQNASAADSVASDQVAKDADVPLDSESLTETTDVAEPLVIEPAPEAVIALEAPEIDVFRFAPDGSGLIAGRGEVGSEIAVLLDGEVIETVDVPAGEEFVAFPFIAPSDVARVVTIEARRAEEKRLAEASFILAPVTPTAEESVVAEVTPVEPAIDAETAAPQVSVSLSETSNSIASAELEELAETVTPSSVVAATDIVPSREVEENVAIALGGVTDAVETALSETPQEEVAVVAEAVIAPVAEEPVIEVPEDTGAGLAAVTETADVQVNREPPTQIATQTAALPEATQPTVQTTAPEQVTSAQIAEIPAPSVQDSPAIAVLRASPEGIEVVQPAAPAVPELVGKVALDTISYSDAGDVQLAGRARPKALVRVYVDNTVVAEVQTAEDGRWSGDLAEVDAGIFTLRLDEIDPVIGTVTSRLETPFKREAREDLAENAAQNASDNTALVRAVTVQEGDTLWAISQERYGNGVLYVRVFEANQKDIRDPDLIYPGQIFTLPE
ncbi:LysM peptidoglycan-binding domain-containing protein [Epibacterium ulvae]|uniref:LysM peptidoglycan-binding domain-containing protein n=1 Tax=Epibacterium ulvae TaxID=1156985 RepID=UPI002491D5E8|nr:LysM peptidoglycan-binding domain-containing protein [Epibacterium ulvae]